MQVVIPTHADDDERGFEQKRNKQRTIVTQAVRRDARIKQVVVCADFIMKK